MIRPTDFLHLPFTPDLNEGGIAYAIRSLPYTYDRMGGSPFNRLRRIVAGVAVELAFRRYLSEEGIPYDVKGATPFTDPDLYDVSLGGHRCDIKSFLISRRRQISSIRADPKVLLKASALVPADQHAADGHRENDLYLFAFLTGLIAASQKDFKKALKAGQPAYLMHAMSKSWSRPEKWIPISPLSLKSESDQNLTVQLGGQAEGREFMTRTLILPPKKRVQVKQSFFSLSSIHINQLPGARIGVYSPSKFEPYLIDQFAWGNVWVYGMDIILAGYLSYDEFRRRASMLQPGSHTFQYTKTKTKNLSVPVAHLKPLPELFKLLRAWKNI